MTWPILDNPALPFFILWALVIVPIAWREDRAVRRLYHEARRRSGLAAFDDAHPNADPGLPQRQRLVREARRIFDELNENRIAGGPQ